MALALGASKPRKKHRTAAKRPALFEVVRAPLIKVEAPDGA
jgi:hypothetical protein